MRSSCYDIFFNFFHNLKNHVSFKAFCFVGRSEFMLTGGVYGKKKFQNFESINEGVFKGLVN